MDVLVLTCPVRSCENKFNVSLTPALGNTEAGHLPGKFTMLHAQPNINIIKPILVYSNSSCHGNVPYNSFHYRTLPVATTHDLKRHYTI